MSQETVSDLGSLNEEIIGEENADLDHELRRKKQIIDNLKWYPKSDKILSHFKQIREQDWSKFGNYRVIRGLKLPTSDGDGVQKYSVEDMIRLS